jgi:lysophospholipase L1-like esterase
MRKILPFWLLFMGFSLAITSLEASGEKKNILGRSAHPLLNQQGELRLVYENPDKGLSLAIRHETTGGDSEHAVLRGQDISSPVIKQDRSGETWVVWEKESFANNDIYCGRLLQNEFDAIERVNDWDAFHHSPDFAFDNEMNVWITWIAYSDFGHDVLVKNMKTHQAWILTSPDIQSAHDPKIVVDAANIIWAFWVGIEMGRDEIFYSIFSGGEWSLPSKLNKNETVPHVYPDVHLGPEGFPWIVWSEYDGDDYEIFCSSWIGDRWSVEERITDNDESDFHPVISHISGSVPIIFWSEASQMGSGICYTYKRGAEWTPEKDLFRSSKKINVFPKIAVHGDQLGITWQSGDEIRWEVLSFAQLEARQTQRIQGTMDSISLNPNLDENAYIGFGDSITYGMMDYQYTPELGYIPRLEALLNDNFGPSAVINEGWPGEVTEYGLARMPDVISAHNARFLLLMEGTNDVVFRRISMDTTAFNLEEMITTCWDYGVFVVLSTIIPREDHRWYKPFFKDRIFELNDKIRNLAVKLELPFVDMFDIFYTYPESDGGWISLLSNDKVHPSIKGYILMTESWFGEIETLPFPPCDVEAHRVHDQILDFIQEGNVITWKVSPKLSDAVDFRAYRIYRLDTNVNPLSFKLIKTLYNRESDVTLMGFLDFPGLEGHGYKYFDIDIEHSHFYKYTLSLVRDDGMEGPLSNTAEDKPKED